MTDLTIEYDVCGGYEGRDGDHWGTFGDLETAEHYRDEQIQWAKARGNTLHLVIIPARRKTGNVEMRWPVYPQPYEERR